MNVSAGTDKAAARIIHIERHLDHGFGRDNALKNIEQNLGNPTACILAYPAML